MFTETTHGKPASSQRLFCAHAACSTHSLIWPMMPISSATGMNVAGDTMPRPGTCQRISASAPMILRVVKSTRGW